MVNSATNVCPSTSVFTCGKMLRIGGDVVTWHNLEGAIKTNGLLGNKCTVVFSMNRNKSYFLMIDRGAIHQLPSEMCLCEVVIDDTSRPFLDFDYDVEESLSIIETTLCDYFRCVHGVDIAVRWKWSYHEYRRWHCVVSGVYFNRCWRDGCLHMVQQLKQVLPEVQPDVAVYRSNSCFRMVTQCKYSHGSYIKRLHPLVTDSIDRLFITHTSTDKCLIVRARPSTHNLPTRVDVTGGFVLPAGFRMHKHTERSDGTSVVELRRVSPSVCIVCRRLHESDNASVVITQTNVEFRCRRNTSTSLIYKLPYV